MAASATLLEPWPLARQPRVRRDLHDHQIAYAVHQSCQHDDCTALHRTAQHSTARQTVPINTLLHTINSLPCSHRACAFSDRCNWPAAGRFHALRCMWQSEAWRARRVRDFGAGLEVSMRACYVGRALTPPPPSDGGGRPSDCRFQRSRPACGRVASREWPAPVRLRGPHVPCFMILIC